MKIKKEDETMKQRVYLFIISLIITILTACAAIGDTNAEINEDNSYTSKDEVALYIHTFNKLPNNYISKSEANELGWKASEGNLWEVTDKKSIGGDRFGNREGHLPE